MRISHQGGGRISSPTRQQVMLEGHHCGQREACIGGHEEARALHRMGLHKGPFVLVEAPGMIQAARGGRHHQANIVKKPCEPEVHELPRRGPAVPGPRHGENRRVERVEGSILPSFHIADSGGRPGRELPEQDAEGPHHRFRLRHREGPARFHLGPDPAHGGDLRTEVGERGVIPADNPSLRQDSGRRRCRISGGGSPRNLDRKRVRKLGRKRVRKLGRKRVRNLGRERVRKLGRKRVRNLDRKRVRNRVRKLGRKRVRRLGPKLGRGLGRSLDGSGTERLIGRQDEHRSTLLGGLITRGLNSGFQDPLEFLEEAIHLSGVRDLVNLDTVDAGPPEAVGPSHRTRIPDRQVVTRHLRAMQLKDGPLRFGEKKVGPVHGGGNRLPAQGVTGAVEAAVGQGLRQRHQEGPGRGHASPP